MTKFAPVLTIFAFLFLSLISSAQQESQKFDELLQKRFSSNAPGASVLIAKDGEIIYRRALGMANLELQIPLHSDHVFRIASITKQFTAAAVMRLASQGKLSLDDEVRVYIEDFVPSSTKAITIEHLLSHTSGLRDYGQTADYEEAALKTDLRSGSLVELVKNQTPSSEPGEEHAYSNLGYVTLGHIVEIVSGLSFADFLQQEFFTPLHMDNTAYDEIESIVPNRVSGYTRNGTLYQNATYLDMRIPHAAGGLHSTAGDLLTWYSKIFEGDVITESHLAKAHSPFELNDGSKAPYGFGWRIGNIMGEPSIKHDGIINGFTSMVIYLPKQKIFIAMLSNCDCNRDIEVPASELAALALGKSLEPISDIKPDQLMSYHGIYKDLDGMEKRVTFQDNALVFHDWGGSKLALRPVGGHRFQVDGQFTFLDFDENTTSLMISGVDGQTLFTKSDEKHAALHSIVLKEEEIDQVLGKYKFPGAFTFEILQLNGRIYGQVGNDRHEIRPFDKHNFFATSLDARLVFEENSLGQIEGLTMLQQREMNATKIVEE